MGLATCGPPCATGLIAAGRGSRDPGRGFGARDATDSQAAVGRLEELAALAAEVGEGPPFSSSARWPRAPRRGAPAQVDAVSAQEAA